MLTGKAVATSRWGAVPGIPWLASILVDEGGERDANCAGSLITDRHILTAALCVREIDPLDLIVTLGPLTDSQRLLDPMLEVARIITHPKADGFIKNDVAILELTDPVPPNSDTICLPKKEGKISGHSYVLG